MIMIGFFNQTFVIDPTGRFSTKFSTNVLISVLLIGTCVPVPLSPADNKA